MAAVALLGIAIRWLVQSGQFTSPLDSAGNKYHLSEMKDWPVTWTPALRGAVNKPAWTTGGWESTNPDGSIYQTISVLLEDPPAQVAAVLETYLKSKYADVEPFDMGSGSFYSFFITADSAKSPDDKSRYNHVTVLIRSDEMKRSPGRKFKTVLSLLQSETAFNAGDYYDSPSGD